MLWYVDSTKTVHRMRVTAGLSDGQKTEVSAPQLAEGMEVVTAVSDPSATTATTPSSSNPFQPARPPGGGMRGSGGR